MIFRLICIADGDASFVQKDNWAIPDFLNDIIHLQASAVHLSKAIIGLTYNENVHWFS
jgi:hypothetical protein